MKQSKLIIIPLLFTGIAFGQYWDVIWKDWNLTGDDWDVTLISEETYSSVILHKLEGNVLYVWQDGESKWIPVEMIKEIRLRRCLRVHKTYVFGGLGAGLGFLAYLTLLEAIGEAEVIVFPPAILFAFLGGVIGSGVGLLADLAYLVPTIIHKYNLSQMTTEEKVKTIQKILNK